MVLREEASRWSTSGPKAGRVSLQIQRKEGQVEPPRGVRETSRQSTPLVIGPLQELDSETNHEGVFSAHPVVACIPLPSV